MQPSVDPGSNKGVQIFMTGAVLEVLVGCSSVDRHLIEGTQRQSRGRGGPSIGRLSDAGI